MKNFFKLRKDKKFYFFPPFFIFKRICALKCSKRRVLAAKRAALLYKNCHIMEIFIYFCRLTYRRGGAKIMAVMYCF